MRDIEFFRLSDTVAKLGQVAAVLKQDMLMLLQLNQNTLKRLEALEKHTNAEIGISQNGGDGPLEEQIHENVERSRGSEIGGSSAAKEQAPDGGG
jgi:hypothetical protein